MRLSLFLILLFSALLCRAQSDASGFKPSPEQDFGAWLSFSFETKPLKSNRVAERQFFKKFRIAAEMGHRRSENASQMDQTYLELSTKYRFKKWFRVAATYRYSMSGAQDANSNRIVFDVNLREDKKRFDFRYRMRYQHNFAGEPQDLDRNFIRNKFALGYNIRKWKLDPMFSTEFFTEFKNQGVQFVGIRYTLSTDYSINKVHSLGLAFRHQREIGVSNPVYENIISISYGYYLK